MNYVFKLFVTGQTSRSRRAVANLNQLVETVLDGQCEIQIIDVLSCTEEAENERILATPTLIKVLPLPMRRIIGDLSELKELMLALDLPNTWQWEKEKGGVIK